MNNHITCHVIICTVLSLLSGELKFYSSNLSLLNIKMLFSKIKIMPWSPPLPPLSDVPSLSIMLLLLRLSFWSHHEHQMSI